MSGKRNHTTQKYWLCIIFHILKKEVPQALAAININEVPDSNWYPNTGTTAI